LRSRFPGPISPPSRTRGWLSAGVLPSPSGVPGSVGASRSDHTKRDNPRVWLTGKGD
jgi:hypothetical protein